MEDTFSTLRSQIVAGEDLTASQMKGAIGQIMTGGCTDLEIGTFLTALAEKGESVAEVAGAAAAMRANMTPILSHHDVLLDTCGTGGGGSTTFNISTTAALVIAAAGVPVAKHGNRSVTSKSGSADVLAGLGVNIEATVPQVERCLNELGICFCFAPLMHPAMKHVAAVRKRLGIRTIFNLLGPLANPAGAGYQLLGVGRPEIRPLIASALGMLGTERSFVVSGYDGLGEVTLAGTTHVTEVSPAGEKEFEWDPEDFAISRSGLDTLQITSPEDSVQLVRSVLDGEPGPARDIVLLNAAAGLLVVGHSASPKEAASVTAEAIDRGKAQALLDQLVCLSHEPAS
ncbi:anthranilate phosphoribosyltransferase [Bythopirellula goksoeyrii]|uniref:Anthranilate phosphoribosyltransferase n=1 Tax=Bythopirellula goksoeyrii TaxID=1400387 RepID=A0A5B9QRK9_9BACT|nr:anthranilate phosphoribosyltransferase [Bythopirellula goksoeyrii]QEG36623.1 Anthranilate phosphoribosyltransferase [Bythopirellula goksoeyrii]